jgi:uncharacterized protein
MRKSILIAVFLSLAAAQETRHEITNKPDPSDNRPNSAQVPDVYAVETRFERVLVLRFKYQTNLLAGIERMVKEKHVKNAVILAGFGSVRNWEVHQVSNRTFPSKNMFVKDAGAPADIAAMDGFIMNGRVHAHVTLSNPDKAFGGHLEPATEVFTFAAVTLGVLPDNLDLSRLDDKTYR